MKILFVLKQRNYLTTFSGAVAALASRGHAVRLAWPDEDVSLPEGLSSPCISVDLWEPKRGDEWAPVVGTVRRAADYLRYLEPEYAAAVKLRARSFEKLLHSLSKGDRVPDAGWSEIGRALTPEERDRLMTVTRLMEQAIPSDAKHEAFIESNRPDAVLVSPLIDLGSAQTDVIKSAKALGIPTGMVLYSWDNLSTKGGLHIHPDRMFVWNELQRTEAETLHDYPIERAIATGAPRFDDFFNLRPATDRQAFFAPLGLDPNRRCLIYLASSKFVITESDDCDYSGTVVRKEESGDVTEELTCTEEDGYCTCRGGDEFGTYEVYLENNETGETEYAEFVAEPNSTTCVERTASDFTVVGEGGAGGSH